MKTQKHLAPRVAVLALLSTIEHYWEFCSQILNFHRIEWLSNSLSPPSDSEIAGSFLRRFKFKRIRIIELSESDIDYPDPIEIDVEWLCSVFRPIYFWKLYVMWYFWLKSSQTVDCWYDYWLIINKSKMTIFLHLSRWAFCLSNIYFYSNVRETVCWI